MSMKMNRMIVLLFLINTIILVGCNASNSKSAPFELTESEQLIYSEIKKDLNENHIINLTPISIAKIYVQAGIDKNYDVQYALYTDRKEYIQWTKEEDKKIPNSDRTTRDQAIKSFTNLDKGEFIQTSDFEGYIEYQSKDEPNNKLGFRMIKDEDGIWNVGFMPLQ
jgi:hypothetical protein